jgi:hypothetical protein
VLFFTADILYDIGIMLVCAILFLYDLHVNSNQPSLRFVHILFANNKCGVHDYITLLLRFTVLTVNVKLML